MIKGLWTDAERYFAFSGLAVGLLLCSAFFAIVNTMAGSGLWSYDDTVRMVWFACGWITARQAT